MMWIDKKDELYKFICQQKKSYEEIGRLYGVTGAYIKKIAKRFGFPLESRRKINPSETFGKKLPTKAICAFCGGEFVTYPSSTNKYCSRKCFQADKQKKNIKRWQDDPSKGTTSFTCSSVVRDYMLKKANYKCEICGWGKENPYSHKIPLQIHHIDGNSLNNQEVNLQVLCPNCHSLTPNFGSRNKNAPNGKSQYYRRALSKKDQ